MSLSARRAWIEILLCRQRCGLGAVALRKESVDRNYIIKITEMWGAVALRKESVDRNFIELSSWGGLGGSLSARRAWIEIHIHAPSPHLCRVALRKESVDRNNIGLASSRACITSLSARRAWIEITPPKECGNPGGRRSPQGERG